VKEPDSTISGGYILLARKLLESELMEKPSHYLKLWVWMLAKANWKNREKLRRGQFRTTISEMQEAGGYRIGYRFRRLTRGEVRSAYEALTKASMITTTKSTRGMIITICNYERYQNPENYEAHNAQHDENTTNNQVTAQDTEEGEKGIIKKLSSSKEEDRRLNESTPDPRALFDLWNETVKGSSLPQAKTFSVTRAGKCKARLKERSLAGWAEIFRKCISSQFLSGASGRGWRADFDWIIRNSDNGLKVLEGSYDDSRKRPGQDDDRYSMCRGL